MRRILLVGIAVVASVLTMAMPAAARLGIAPAGSTSLHDDAIILVKGGHGHGHGHGRMHRGGRGHHYGWGRGRGHHYGWSRGRHRGHYY
jgi:hypothetical protein